MKKLFTLALVLLVTVAGYSQVKKASFKDAKMTPATKYVTRGMETFENVQSEPNMVRGEITPNEFEYTTYDWQTNAGIINRTIVWPDNKVHFAFTTASDNSFTDRGTGIGTYDYNNDEWTSLGGRIENEKTGFGSICRYRANGMVVAAHTATECGFYLIEDKDNMVAGSAAYALRLDPTNDPCWPVVMTSGPNRDIIHIIATGYADNKLYYFRSSDGGQSWDKQNEIIPFLSEEYGSDWGSNVAYWMETTEDNRLALVVNNAWSDCMVIYSYDNGDTWERKVFWHHPGINTTIDDWFMYPRWASCVWNNDGELCIAYEFNGSTGEPGSGSYYPGIGGVAFWSENMPYHGETVEYTPDPTNPMPPTPGQPFIMDSAYIFNDLYASWWLWSDATHEMWPEFMGYLPALTEEGEVEPDPYAVTEFNLQESDSRSLHGGYNCGCVAMPTLCKVPGSDDLVAVWSAMDEESNPDDDGNYFFKLFASYSQDGGLTWSPQVHLTNDFMLSLTEHVYLQAAVIGSTLIVAVQCDGETGTFVQDGDDEAGDNVYTGYTFELAEIMGLEEEVSHNTHMTLYPNPATDQVNVTLSRNADIRVYNVMGQNVMTVEGHLGANTINISNLNSGIYFINAGSETQKFIVK